MDTTSRRLMPLLCFQCSMPLNNRQQTFDNAICLDDGRTKEQIFDALSIQKPCCRVTMAFSADDTRLHRFAAPASTFVSISRASKLDSAVYTVKADGSADPITI